MLPDLAGFAAEVVAVSMAEDALGRTETMLGLRMDSSWKWTRAAISSLENSFGRCVPAIMGAVKRGQRLLQQSRNAGKVREAAFIRESCTAAQKRVHRSRVSCCVVPVSGSGGVRDRMRTNSCFEYGGKCRFADVGVRRKPAGGDVTMNITVRLGICQCPALVTISRKFDVAASPLPFPIGAQEQAAV